MHFDRTQKNVLVTLFLIALVSNIEKSVIGVMGPYLTSDEYMGRLGLETFTHSQFGMITTLFYLSFIIMTFGAGYFVDKFGYTKFIPTALILLAIGSIFFGLAGFSSTSAIFILLPLARFVIGFGQAAYTNGAPPVVAKIYRQEQRGSVQGKVVSTAGIGTIVSYLVFDQLIIAKDFRWMYFLIAAMLVVVVIMFVRLVPKDTVNRKDSADPASQVRFKDAWTNRNTLVLALALLLNNAVGVGLLVWANTMMRETYSPTPTQNLIIMTMFGVTVFIATATGPDIINRLFPLQEKRFMLVTSILAGISMLGIVGFKSLWLAAFSLWLANLFIMWAFSGILVLPFRLVPIHIVGSAFAVISIGAFVGGMAQGYLVGALVDATGTFVGAFVMLAVGALLAGIVPFMLSNADPNGATAALRAKLEQSKK